MFTEKNKMIKQNKTHIKIERENTANLFIHASPTQLINKQQHAEIEENEYTEIKFVII